jgi:two-component system, sensor histidine kinase PdtaS
MASLDDIVRARTELSEADLDGLHVLLGEWQILADLSFADLVLWLPTRDGKRFVAAGQMRATTAPTLFADDLVGTERSRAAEPVLAAALAEGRQVAPAHDHEGVATDAIPVRRSGRVIAVITRSVLRSRGREGWSALEDAYVASADELARMIAEGRFPYPAMFTDPESAPRVGDGLLRLDADGVVTFASPNAVSAYRRLGHIGDLVGEDLSVTTRRLAAATGPVDEALSAVAAGRAPRGAELEAAGAHMLLRAIPIIPGGVRTGALVLVRDVTDLRRRDQMMATKDATIREVHHRVKNNLQTVAALLRLQARRMDSPSARAALEEAVRRVGSIAVVHETLSQTPDDVVAFDDIADRLMAMVVHVGGEAEGEGVIQSRRAGTFGVLPAEVATPLAMALTEVLQNAVEHGFGGRGGLLQVTASRDAGRLRVAVVDDGQGLPPGFDADSDGKLGLQIVRTLVVGEMAGTLDLGQRRGGGTRAVIDVPVGRTAAAPTPGS